MHVETVLIKVTHNSLFQPFRGSFSREMGQILLHIVYATTFHQFKNDDMPDVQQIKIADDETSKIVRFDLTDI